VGTTQQDPTQAAFSDASQVPDVPKSGLEKGMGIVAGLTTGRPKGGPLDEAIEKHHQQRLDEARMHRKTAATAAGILTYGIDPTTGKPLVDPQTGEKLVNPKTGNAYIDEYTNDYKTAMGHYEKVAGVSKEAKEAIKKSRMLIEHMIQQGQKNPGGQGGQPGPTGPAAAAQGGAPPPPPAAPSPAQQPAGPQGGPPPPVPFAEEAPFLRGQLSEQREFQSWKRQQTLLHDFRMEEEAAKEKARAASKSSSAPPRPVFSRPVSVLDSRTLASHGQVFEDENGDLIDTENIPESMSLQPFTTRVTETDDDGNSKQVWKTRYLKISPNQKTFTVGNETYGVNPADVTKSGAPTALGEHNVPTTRRTTDPATRQTTVSTSTPSTSGIRTGGVPPPPNVPNATTPTAPVKRTGTGTGQKPSAKDSSGVLPLDENGHIPDGQTSPQITQGANDILDGTALSSKDLPAKTRGLSEELARKYGWSQGKFNRLEQTQIALASRYINEALESPALKTLDKGFIAQLPMLGAMGDPAKEGYISRALTKLAARAQTPQQAEFMRLYRQLAGTISGLGKLSRGGRITEATVNRLLSELPNPANTKDSADAIARLHRLDDEIKAALSNGSFKEISEGRAGGPPAPSNTPKMSDAARKYLDSQGIKVP
jgi:hypothetical protein